MVTRFRPVFGVLTALILVLLPAFGSGTASASAASADEALTVADASSTSSLQEATTPRLPRPAAPMPVALIAAIALAGIQLACTPRRLLDHLRRRLDDVGDDWRSLLLGAPPARA